MLNITKKTPKDILNEFEDALDGLRNAERGDMYVKMSILYWFGTVAMENEDNFKKVEHLTKWKWSSNFPDFGEYVDIWMSFEKFGKDEFNLDTASFISLVSLARLGWEMWNEC